MAAILPDFSWGVGIEDTFIPQTRPGLRALDEYELTAHYRLWREDFDLLKESRASHVRWGIPWYRVNPAPGVFDWGWIDQALDYLVTRVECVPIIDLMHYGTPLWLENAFINASYPERVAEYAHAFAERYKHLVRYYTPLNEPLVNAIFCGRLGQWPPYLEGDDGYVKVLMQVCRGLVLTERALREADPEAIIVQVEAVEHHYTAAAELGERVGEEIAHVYLPFELFTGRVGTDHMLWPFLRRNGVTETDLGWLRERPIKVDIVGVNYYPFSGGAWAVNADSRPSFARGVTSEHMAAALRETWRRFGLPMMVTETSCEGSVAERIAWMDDSVGAVRQVMSEGIPVLGYTWWPLFDMVEWEYRVETGPLHRYRVPAGLWANKFANLSNPIAYSVENGVWASRYGGLDTLTREPTPLVEHFRGYAGRGLRTEG
ncbi:MAG: family 1 glycosylhydrolase [Chloroflexia bacterium]